MAFEFKFPDVGEGIHEGEIVKWRVKVGDEVKEDQPLVEMETAKAVVEMPSPKAGTVLARMGDEGGTVHVGDTLVVIGAKGEKWTGSKAALGVIGQIPTEEKGVTLPSRTQETQTPKTSPAAPASNRDTWGPVEHIPLKGVRKAIAEHMVKSKFTIPHVTHMDEADATKLISARTAKKPLAEKQNIKLTFLPFIIKAITESLKKHPALNAAFDDKTGREIVYKKYFNIGVAVDTEEGLMMPIIKNADTKDVFQIAQELNELAQKCRDRKINISELQGGTFSITNIGSVGGIFATPIIAYGQTANLGIFRIKEKPVALDGKVVIRPILSLALSFDHRVVDGAQAARFMNDLIAGIENVTG